MRGAQSICGLRLTAVRMLIGLSACLAPSAFADEPPADPEPGVHYDRARELYSEGPSKAAEILAELELELAEHPDSLEALSLKATTQIGIGEFEAALKTLDRFDEINDKSDTMSPGGIFLRARCLYHMGKYEEARLRLEPFWAFFQDDPKSKARYDQLMAAIMAKLPAASPE